MSTDNIPDPPLAATTNFDAAFVPPIETAPVEAFTVNNDVDPVATTNAAACVLDTNNFEVMFTFADCNQASDAICTYVIASV